MNTNQGALYFGAGIDLNQWRRDVDSMRRDIVGLTKDVEKETRNVDSAFKNLSIGIAGYFSVNALKGFAMELINVRGEFQKTEIAFTTMLGSQAQATKLMGQMTELAAKTPFSLQEVSAGAKQLLAFQIPANQVVDTLTRMGNIAAGLGVPLSRINLVYGQVRAKGRLMGDDLRQFTEAGIPMVAELAKKFNKTTAEITEMVSAGKIGFKDVQEVLFNMTNEGGMFFNLMEKQSASLSGKVANLGDAWDQMLNKIGQSSEGVLYGAIESATYLVDNYKEVAEILLELIAAYGIYKAAVIATSVISTNYNKTIASEIALLGISDKMKLGRAMVTQRQAEATARDTVSELANVRAKYTGLQAEVSSLAIKKQAAIQSGITATAKAQEARVQLSLARLELTSIQSTGTAREIEIAQKRVVTAQNTVIATQETAAIARKRALAAATEFNTAKQQLENTAQAVGIAEKTAATAAETAQVAAKNANSIATTRLTFLQTLQTFATQAGARAQLFLNQTILANPYAIAAVLLAAMTYAIYKQANALTALEEIQKKFNEELSQANVGVNEQTAKLNSLIAVIKKQSTSYEEAKKILAQVNALTNNRIEGLTVESIKTGEADAAIKAYTKSLYRQAEVMLKVQEIAKLEEQRKKLTADIADETFMERVSATLNPFDKNYYSGSFQGAKEEELKAIDKTIGDYKKDVEKAIKDGLDLSGNPIEVEPPKIKLGILEGLNEELKAANEAIQKAGSDAEINKWKAVRDRIQAKIDSYGLKKKKTKTENRQLAEIFAIGTPKEIQQQMRLLEESMSLVDKGMVKLRKLDKYGNDKDKKGNPYFTGEIISLEEAGKRYDKLDADLKAKQYKNFQERISEAERQWNNYYKMAEFYGKESADAQYKELFKGSQSYLEYLEKIQTSLNFKKDSGQLFTETDKNNLVDITDKINQLTGVKTPLENFKKDIENSLKELPALTDQITLLDQELAKAQLQEGNVNTSELLGKTNLIKEKKEEILNLQKDLYREFIIEQTTFEDKKSAIEKKYNLIRQQIGLNQSLTETERLRQLDEAGKDEAKEYGNAFLDTFKKTKLWEKIFGNMNTISKREVEKLIPILKAQIAKLISLNAPIEEIERYKQKLEELETFTSGNSPVEKLVASFKKLTKQAKNADGKIDWRNFAKNYESFSEALSASVDTAFELGDALGFMGNTDGMKETINNLMETTKGLVNAIAGYASGDYAQMAGGIVQATIGLSKMLSGDDDKSFYIRGLERDINNLKTAYEQLNREIAKTAGSEQFDKQKQLVSNLESQKKALQDILKLEKEKKKPDSGKVNEYENQIAQINGQIEDLVDNFLDAIAQTNFKDLATQLSDALTEAFGKGEDAALAYEKVVDDVMRNAVKNALKIAILEPATKKIVDSLISSMGYGSGSNSAIKKDIADAEKLLNDYEQEQLKLFQNNQGFSYRASELTLLIKDLKAKIDALKTQATTSQSNGSFDGLTKEERDKIKEQGIEAMNQYTAALQQYQDLFGGAAENAQGLKGDIKGITEKTAGALEAQFNAFRINLVALLQVAKQNNTVQNAHTVLLSQIEVNTRHLYTIRKDIAELNQKVKKGAAGIP